MPPAVYCCSSCRCCASWFGFYVCLFVCLFVVKLLHKDSQTRGGSRGIIVSRACPSPPPHFRGFVMLFLCFTLLLLRYTSSVKMICLSMHKTRTHTHTHKQKFTTHDRLIHFLLPKPRLDDCMGKNWRWKHVVGPLSRQLGTTPSSSAGSQHQHDATALAVAVGFLFCFGLGGVDAAAPLRTPPTQQRQTASSVVARDATCTNTIIVSLHYTPAERTTPHNTHAHTVRGGFTA